MREIDYVQASRWDVSAGGSFIIEANIGSLLEQGKGVYTIAIWVEISDKSLNLLETRERLYLTPKTFFKHL